MARRGQLGKIKEIQGESGINVTEFAMNSPDNHTDTLQNKPSQRARREERVDTMPLGVEQQDLITREQNSFSSNPKSFINPTI